MVTHTPPVPPYLPTHPGQLASGSTQPGNFCGSWTTIPRMILDRELHLCPGCYATHFSSVCTWSILYANSGFFAPWWYSRNCRLPQSQLQFKLLLRIALDPPTSAPFKIVPGREDHHKHVVGARSKLHPHTVQEFRRYPFTSSRNISLPYPHISSPPDIELPSRRFVENHKWERARRDAVGELWLYFCPSC
ncbi:hypothetical protein BDM02DRAFT_1372376 [Thelephora ganbajun]|uniref:Uncharacterized protein n=1 Tax=Thelephora ganbajun TaxID=370292 RepID=A0ACB6Z1Q7_THEGA|nr:hypothetical protein BDM02DRAFT_1372376 [Thelephora ganbajun]